MDTVAVIESGEASVSARLEDVVRCFEIEGVLTEALPYGSGHINDTFLITCENRSYQKRERYVLQQINTHVFPDPVALMDNFCLITDHLRQKFISKGAVDVERRVLRHVSAANGRAYVIDNEGGFWRATHFVGDTQIFETASEPEQLFMAGKAFGAFQNLLADLAHPLTETIVDFHHTPKRFTVLQAAVAADEVQRADAVQAEISFAFARKSFASVLLDLVAQKQLPIRLIHNDTKISNVLFDRVSGEALCMTDLDTVMPGLAGYDFGELVRSGVSDSAEDERELGRVRVDFGRFEQITAGYLATANGMLTEMERAHLVTAAKMMTFENGIRFLTDYLQGDIYFKTERPQHNLDRCRAQFALLKSLEDNDEALQETIRRLGAV